MTMENFIRFCVHVCNVLRIFVKQRILSRMQENFGKVYVKDQIYKGYPTKMMVLIKNPKIVLRFIPRGPPGLVGAGCRPGDLTRSLPGEGPHLCNLLRPSGLA